MSIARALVEKHGKIAAVVFPLSVMGGFAYTMATGSVPVREQQAADGEGPDSAHLSRLHRDTRMLDHRQEQSALTGKYGCLRWFVQRC
jgi:hypothetical protein